MGGGTLDSLGIERQELLRGSRRLAQADAEWSQSSEA
jgi:hypothetical protein